MSATEMEYQVTLLTDDSSVTATLDEHFIYFPVHVCLAYLDDDIVVRKPGICLRPHVQPYLSQFVLPHAVLEKCPDRAYSAVYTGTHLSVPFKDVPFERGSSSLAAISISLPWAWFPAVRVLVESLGLQTRTSRLGMISMTASTLNGFAMCSRCRPQNTRTSYSRTASVAISPPPE
jgi:hypothetical protein